jgi:glycosyltransferase involved in cell wall biosynthesis
MRILCAAERLGPGGGSERFLDLLLGALAEHGHRVLVLVRKLDAVPANIDAEQVAWADEHDEPSTASAKAVRDAIERFKPDLAMAHNVMDSAVVEALRSAPRLTYHVHDHRPFCPNGDRLYPRSQRNCTAPLGRACVLHALVDGCAYGPRPRTLGLIRRRERLRNAVRAADRVMVGTTYVGELARGSGVGGERLYIARYPLPNEAYAETVASSSTREIIFAGRIVPQKGLASLVRAVATIPADTRPTIRVLGDGPALTDARLTAQELGVSLAIFLQTSVEVVRRGIDETAFLVLPSLWAEPFGLVGIEAQARGRPVVAYGTASIAAWLEDDRNGVSVKPGDEAALGRAIADLLDDELRRRRLGEQARVDAERYRLEPWIDDYVGASAGAVVE